MNSSAEAGFCEHRTAFRAGFSDLSRISPTLLLRDGQSQQRPAQLEKIDQSASHVKPLGIFGNPAVAHLGEAKDLLQYQEGMLHFGAHTRLVAILSFLDLVDLPLIATAPIRHV